MTTDHQERQALLAQLRGSGDPQLVARADQLAGQYHARELAGLSHDVYDSARARGEPPHGWVRASENLDLLRERMPGLQADDTALLDLLRPEASGFRAEIYLPDPAILGPGYQPTVVFKGSANEVVGPDGQLRGTAAEDFLGNNFPQSIGLKTDYYDRAMNLATELQRQGLDFDLSGHSLAGGMASAASAVTGMRAVTFNAAGLHPETTARFSHENGGLPLYDTGPRVTAWQVRGDLLNDGVQGDLANMGSLERQRMAGLLSDVSSVLQNVPQARSLLEDKLLDGIPAASHPSINAFLDRLAAGDTAHLIRDLPQAAGDRQPALEAMTQQEQALVRRENAASIGDLQRLGGPLLNVAWATARGADMGRSAGEQVAGGGRAIGGGVAWTGDVANAATSGFGQVAERGYQYTGATVDIGTRAAGEVAAHARQAGAGLEALGDHGRGIAQQAGSRVEGAMWRGVAGIAGIFSDSARDDLEARASQAEAQGDAARMRSQVAADDAIARGATDAAGWRNAAGAAGQDARQSIEQFGAGRRQAYVYVGQQLDSGAEVAGAEITRVTSHAPVAGAALGGTTGFIAGGVVTYNPGTPYGALNLASTVRLATEAGRGVQESLGRHGMDSAMIPSLDRVIAEQEQAARAQLQQREAERATPAPVPDASVRDDTASRGRSTDVELTVERLLAAARGGASDVRETLAGVMESSAARAWLARGGSAHAVAAVEAPTPAVTTQDLATATAVAAARPDPVEGDPAR